jgi:hypothetical protein
VLVIIVTYIHVGPIEITKREGLAAYKVALLPNLVVKRDVFHVLKLRYKDLIRMINLFCLGLYA